MYSFPNFNNLSPELKRYLLKFLELTDLCALTQTCHEMKHVTYNADSEWTLPAAVRNECLRVTNNYSNFLFRALSIERRSLNGTRPRKLSNRAQESPQCCKNSFTPIKSTRKICEVLTRYGGKKRNFNFLKCCLTSFFKRGIVPIFAAVPNLNTKFGVARVALQRIVEAHEKLAVDLQRIHIGEAGYEEFAMISALTIFSSLVCCKTLIRTSLM